MSLTSVASSPFILNGHQLFFQASLNRQTHKVQLKIFNHRGVLKNRRNLNFPQNIVDLFATQKYLIGFNSNHISLCIADITLIVNGMVKGTIPDVGQIHKEINDKSLKFTYFYYEPIRNIIFGILDNHHVFYFDITSLDNSNRKKQGSVLINKLYTSKQFINKFQVRNSKRQNNIKVPKRKSYIAKLQEQLQFEQSRAQWGQKQTVNQLCLLIKQKNLIRILQVDWNDDSVTKKQTINNVFDFSFQNGWHLLILTQQKSMSKKKPHHKYQQHEYQLLIKQKGQYTASINLSGSQQIFSSDQTILIVDPTSGTITGVHHKLFVQVKNCNSIPRNIGLSNTILMVDRVDQAHMRFLFQVLDLTDGQFRYVTILAPSYNVQVDIQLEIYLGKNIEKVFTVNGLIHPNFQEQVERLCRQNLAINLFKSHDSSAQKACMNQSNNMQRQDQDIIKSQNTLSPEKLAKIFLGQFVMKDKYLLDRLLGSLSNYGLRVLFQNKSSIKSSFDRSSNGQNYLSSQNYPKHKIIHQDSEILQQAENYWSEQNCNFDRWNRYFQQIVQKYIKDLNQLFQLQIPLQYPDEPISNSYQSQNQNTIQYLQQNLYEIRKKISLVGNIYLRFLKLIQTSDSIEKQDQELAQYVEFNKNIIMKNVNKCHSLFLIFDMFQICKTNQRQKTDQNDPQMKIQKLFMQIFKQFSKQRQKSIKYLKSKLNLSSGGLNLQINYGELQIPSLMLHQHFKRAKLLAIPIKALNLQLILHYFLVNLEQFQQIAYFYFILYKQVSVFDRGQIEMSLDSSQATFPYMGTNLTKFFELVTNISLHKGQKWKDDKLNSQKSLIQKASQKALKLGVQVFTNYMIQLCTQYSMPQVLMKLVQSVKLSPFTRQFKDRNSFKIRQISQYFIQNELLIMKSLIICSESANSNRYSLSRRQMLLFEVKRILQIDNVLRQQQNSQNQQRIYRNEQLKKIQGQNRFSPSQTVKRLLLEQFVMCLISPLNRNPYFTNIRFIEQIKNQYFSSAQDKKVIESVIQKAEHVQNQTHNQDRDQQQIQKPQVPRKTDAKIRVKTNQNKDQKLLKTTQGTKTN